MEILIDNNSALGLHFQTKTFNESFNPSMADIKAISPKEYAMLEMLRRAFFSDTLEDEFFPVTVAYRNGTYQGIYPPVARALKDSPKLAICASLLVNEAFITKEGRSTALIKINGQEIEAGISQTEINGYDREVLSLTWEKGEQFLTLFLPLGLPAVKEGEAKVKVETLKTALLKNEIGQYLTEPPKPQLNMIGLRQLLPGSYTVVDTDSWEKDGKINYSLTIVGAVDENDLPTQAYHVIPEDIKTLLDAPTEALGTVKVYAHDKFKPLLAQDPDVSEDKPATLIIESVTQSKNGYSVKCGMSYHPDQVFRNKPKDLGQEFDLSMILG